MSTQSTCSACDSGLGTRPLAVTIPAAKFLSGLGNTTIRKLIGNDTLKTVRVGRRRLIVYASLKALLEPNHSAPSNSPASLEENAPSADMATRGKVG
jgi:excisionase family DNA binding protein